MKVILVNEDNHGLLTVAKDYKAALDYLLDSHWIEDNTEVWDERIGWWVELKYAQGEDWFDDMCHWSIDKFNDYWDGSFYLNETEVYE